MYQFANLAVPLDSLVDEIVRCSLAFPHRLDPLLIIDSLNKDIFETLRKPVQLKEQQLDLHSFIRLMLIHHNQSPQNIIYYVTGLIQLFSWIVNARPSGKSITFSDFTSFVCQHISNAGKTHKIDTHLYPEFSKLKDIQKEDLQAPKIIQHSSFMVLKLAKEIYLSDRTKHFRKPIKTGCYAKKIQLIFVLDSLAPFVSIYSLDLNLRGQIRPKNFAKNKEISIIDMSFSERQARIGVILKDIGLCFWEAADQFTCERNIAVNGHQFQFIQYLPFFKVWMTSGKNGALTAWDLASDQPSYVLNSTTPSHITAFCQMPTLGLLAVAYSPLPNFAQKAIEERLQSKQKGIKSKRVTLWDMDKRSAMVQIDVSNFSPHTLVFMQNFQVLLSVGFQTQICVFKVQPVYLDVELCGKFIGHKGLVTTLTEIRNTATVASADDRGDIKLWDIRSLNCIQTLSLGKRANICLILDMQKYQRVAFLDNRINYIQYDNKIQNYSEQHQIKISSLQLSFETRQLRVFTSQGVFVYALSDGRSRFILRFNLDSQEEIDIVKSSSRKDRFLVCNLKGQIRTHIKHSEKTLEKLNGHLGQITDIKVDPDNGLFVSLGEDGKLLVQKQIKSLGQNPSKFEVLRVCNKVPKHLNVMQLGLNHNLILLGDKGHELYLLDFQELKVFTSLKFPVPHVDFKIDPQFPLIHILFKNGCLLILSFVKHDLDAFFTLHSCLTFGGKVSACGDPQSTDTFLTRSSNTCSASMLQLTSQHIYIASPQGRVQIYNYKSIRESLSCHNQPKSTFNLMKLLQTNFIDDSRSVPRLSLFPFNPATATLTHQSTVFQSQERIQALIIISFDLPYFVLTQQSTFRIVQVREKQGVQICSVNIKQPYPRQWQSLVNSQRFIRQKIINSLLVIRDIYVSKKLYSYYEETNIRSGRFLQPFRHSAQVVLPVRPVRLISQKLKKKSHRGMTLKEIDQSMWAKKLKRELINESRTSSRPISEQNQQQSYIVNLIDRLQQRDSKHEVLSLSLSMAQEHSLSKPQEPKEKFKDSRSAKSSFKLNSFKIDSISIKQRARSLGKLSNILTQVNCKLKKSKITKLPKLNNKSSVLSTCFQAD